MRRHRLASRVASEEPGCVPRLCCASAVSLFPSYASSAALWFRSTAACTGQAHSLRIADLAERCRAEVIAARAAEHDWRIDAGLPYEQLVRVGAAEVGLVQAATGYIRSCGAAAERARRAHGEPTQGSYSGVDVILDRWEGHCGLRQDRTRDVSQYRLVQSGDVVKAKFEAIDARQGTVKRHQLCTASVELRHVVQLARDAAQLLTCSAHVESERSAVAVFCLGVACVHAAHRELGQQALSAPVLVGILFSCLCWVCDDSVERKGKLCNEEGLDYRAHAVAAHASERVAAVIALIPDSRVTESAWRGLALLPQRFVASPSSFGFSRRPVCFSEETWRAVNAVAWPAYVNPADWLIVRPDGAIVDRVLSGARESVPSLWAPLAMVPSGSFGRAPAPQAASWVERHLPQCCALPPARAPARELAPAPSPSMGSHHVEARPALTGTHVRAQRARCGNHPVPCMLYLHAWRCLPDCSRRPRSMALPCVQAG